MESEIEAEIQTLIHELADAQCELKELNASGDLEDRLEAALKVDDLKHKLAQALARIK